MRGGVPKVRTLGTLLLWRCEALRSNLTENACQVNRLRIKNAKATKKRRATKAQMGIPLARLMDANQAFGRLSCCDGCPGVRVVGRPVGEVPRGGNDGMA